jgi:hypothetical protein
MLLLLRIDEDLGAASQVMDAAMVFIELLDNSSGVHINSRDSLQDWFFIRQILIVKTHNSHV